jgi:uncharacterized membrane protein
MAKSPTHKNNPAVTRVQHGQVSQVQHVQQTIHQGPIPHPDILRGFDELVPGTAKRLIDLAESESVHRRDLESRAMASNIESQKKQLELSDFQNRIVHKSDRNGLIAGVMVAMASVFGAVWLSLHDHDWVAGLLAAIPTAAVIKAFFSHRPSSK